MRQHSNGPKALQAIVRLRATTRLREQISAQGRRHDWLAERLGFSKSFISKVVARRRAISEADARVMAALLNGDVEQLFERLESGEPASMAPTAAGGNVQ